MDQHQQDLDRLTGNWLELLSSHQRAMATGLVPPDPLLVAALERL